MIAIDCDPGGIWIVVNLCYDADSFPAKVGKQVTSGASSSWVPSPSSGRGNFCVSSTQVEIVKKEKAENLLVEDFFSFFFRLALPLLNHDKNSPTIDTGNPPILLCTRHSRQR